MRKFCLKISILILLFITTVFGIFVVLRAVPLAKEDFAGAIVDKHELLKNSDKKKMVFISGSNLIYGLDSDLIEEECDYDVVNAALTFGVGLKFMLKDIEPYLNSDDIVIIAPEYNHFTANVHGDETVNYILAQFLPDGYSMLDIEQWDSLIKNLPKYFSSKLRLLSSLVKTGQIETSPYLYRSGFDNNGDLEAHLDYPNPDINTVGLSSESLNIINEEAIKVMNSFVEGCKEKGVEIYMTYPALYEKQYELWSENINNIEETIRDNIDVKIISKPEDYVFGAQYIFDSIYHLNRDGREIRTKQIINDLKRNGVI